MFKKTSILSAAALCIAGLNVAVAAPVNNTGAYFGAQIGESSGLESFNPVDGLVYNKMDDSGFAAHINAGWAFNKNLGLEVGYQYIPKYTFTVRSFNSKTSNTKENFTKNYVDLALKATANIGNVGLFIKPGIAWAHQGKISVTYSDGTKSTILSGKNQIAPLLGAGVLYNFNNHWSADLSTTAYFKSKDINGVIFAGVGLTYRV